MKISELMEGIRNRDLVLPEFQREYVWNKEQGKQLMVSLVKDYPVGGLLFWKTDHPPELKNVDKLPERLGTIQVILDGQQRLTTLCMLINGEIPAYYTDRDVEREKDPRDLYYNLESADFQYYRASEMEGNPLWWRVVDCMKRTDINVFEIAQKQSATPDEAFRLAQLYNGHLTRLRQVRDIDLPTQSVPPHATLEDAITIFDLVNSQGTKLTDAELALTHVTGKWSQARRIMKSRSAELGARHFPFDLTFMTRALTGVVSRRALFPTIHGQPKEALEKGWSRLDKILDYLVAILPKHAFIDSTDDLNTTNVLIPWVVYLAIHDGRFRAIGNLKKATHWLYAAHIWSRYTSQTDQRLEHDVSIVVRESDPWDALREQIIDQRGRIDVKSSDLEGRGIQHPLYRMTYTLAKAHGAVDWFNGVPLGTPHHGAYQLHTHHIFPQAVLYNKSGYDPENHLHRTIINEIANRAFLTAASNQGLGSKSPEVYLPEVEAMYPGALAKQFIPMDPVLWRLDHFAEFLEARRSLIAQKINEFMRTLVTEPEVVHKCTVSELISLGESATLEFKSTLQWDVVQRRVNKELRLSVLKTIAAFLNSSGGTLVIGVEDNGSVCGLKNDIEVMGGSRDQFGQTLANLIGERVGEEFAPFVRTRFEQVSGETVCVADVDRAPRPAFVQGPDSKQFYVRLGNTTRSLDTEDTHNYIQTNWD